MNTREMLEFAAIAAGFYFDPTVKSEHGGIYGCFDDKAQEAYFWDPIANAADRQEIIAELARRKAALRAILATITTISPEEVKNNSSIKNI
jgi:hypothetical protein